MKNFLIILISITFLAIVSIASFQYGKMSNIENIQSESEIKVVIDNVDSSVDIANEEIKNVESKPIGGIIGELYGNSSLKVGNTSYELHLQEPTKFINIPEDRITPGMKKTMDEVGEDYVWYGLLGTINEVLLSGETIEVVGEVKEINNEDGGYKAIATDTIRLIQ